MTKDETQTKRLIAMLDDFALNNGNVGDKAVMGQKCSVARKYPQSPEPGGRKMRNGSPTDTNWTIGDSHYQDGNLTFHDGGPAISQRQCCKLPGKDTDDLPYNAHIEGRQVTTNAQHNIPRR